MIVAVVASLLAVTADAQPFNTEKPVEPVTGDGAPLGDDGVPLGAPLPPPAASSTSSDFSRPMTAPPDGVSAKPTANVEWADHVSPSFRRWIEGTAADTSPPARPARPAATSNVEWAEHVSPSFRRWVNDETAQPVVAPADPAVRNQPGPDQRASDLAGVENALDKPPAVLPDSGGAGASTLFMKRASRAHARSIVGPEGSLMGAELADGISMAPLKRSRAKGTLFDRQLPDAGALPKLANGPLPGDGPLQEIPAEPRYDGRPLYNEAAAPDEPADSRAYLFTLAKGDGVGVELGDKVSVVHISQFAKGERPDGGEFVVYPRGRFRPWGAINSFEEVNSFQAINVEPLQSAEDPSDPSPVARSAYSIGNWELPLGYQLPLADSSMYDRREWLIRHLNDCCGRNYVSVIHDPLALVLNTNGIFFLPGQTATLITPIPLVPGISHLGSTPISRDGGSRGPGFP